MSQAQTDHSSGPTDARWAFTVQELAARTGWSATLIRQEIAGGRSAAIRLGRTVRIPRSEIERLIGGPLPDPCRHDPTAQVNERSAGHVRGFDGARARLAEQLADGDWTEQLMDTGWAAGLMALPEGLMEGEED